MDDGSYLCEIVIPNREIEAVYRSEILSHLYHLGVVSLATANKIAECIYTTDLSGLQGSISEFLQNTISYYDSGSESFYHGLTLGLVAILDNKYTIKSNRESGSGRFDICLEPRDERTPAILMELKYQKASKSDSALRSIAEDALQQIDEKNYDQEFLHHGINKIIKLGVAYSGKRCVITSRF